LGIALESKEERQRKVGELLAGYEVGKPFLITYSTMRGILGDRVGTVTIAHVLRDIPFAFENIVPTYYDSPGGVGQQTKYLKLTSEDFETYKFSRQNFRWLFNADVESIVECIKQKEPEITNKTLFKLLSVCDMMLLHNDNTFKLIPMQKLVNVLRVDKKTIDMFVSSLVDAGAMEIEDVNSYRKKYRVAEKFVSLPGNNKQGKRVEAAKRTSKVAQTRKTTASGSVVKKKNARSKVGSASSITQSGAVQSSFLFGETGNVVEKLQQNIQSAIEQIASEQKNRYVAEIDKLKEANTALEEKIKDLSIKAEAYDVLALECDSLKKQIIHDKSIEEFKADFLERLDKVLTVLNKNVLRTIDEFKTKMDADQLRISIQYLTFDANKSIKNMITVDRNDEDGEM